MNCSAQKLESFIAIFTFFFYITSYSMNTLGAERADLFALSANQSEEKQIRDIVKSMSLDEKIGQLFTVATVADPLFCKESSLGRSEMTYLGVSHFSKEYIEYFIKNYHIGGLIFQRRSTPHELREAIDHYQLLNAKFNKIPLWINQDLEWGLDMHLSNVVCFPKNMTLGAIKNDELLYALGKEIGRQCRVLGVHLNNAPVIDINTNPANPIIGDRSFGENKELVARKGRAIMKGLQDAGIISCAKHFPGHGDTAVDSHAALPVIAHDLERINAIELYPFKILIAEGVRAIMTAHISVPALNTQDKPASFSNEVVTELLKKRLGFSGIVITDGLDMKGSCQGREEGEAELLALLAGNDILLCPPAVAKASERIKKAIKEDVLSESELDDHVCKILVAKAWVFAQQEEQPATEYLYEQLHTDYTYDLKRKLYCSAITLVRNEHNLLPLKKTNQSIAYVQIGQTEKTPFAQTLETEYSFATYNMSADASSEDIDELISQINSGDTVIVGMHCMNRIASQQYGITESIKAMMNALKEKNRNIILVLFGSPYSLRWFENIPAILVAYEDDPDAQIAAAEILIGKHVPQGILPVTASEKFAVGTGLSYKVKN